MSGRFLASLAVLGVAAFAFDQAEIELLAKRRVFPEMGAGLVALKKDAAGRYLILSSRASGAAIYDVKEQRLGQIPPAPLSAGSTPSNLQTQSSALAFASDLDITSDGRIVIADRGANALKFYDAAGALVQTVAFPQPSSVAALAEGEVATTSAAFGSAREQNGRLIVVFDKRGKEARTFADPVELAERRDLNRFLNIGRVLSDPASALYYAFTFLPEPTVRKFDRFGYSTLEIVLATPEFMPAAQAARREIKRQDEHRAGTPQFKTILNALGVDPESHHIWLATGNVLLHFDAEGTRLATYRCYTDEGARLEPIAILVEPGRLLLASDPLGIYEFTRPDKPKQ